MPTTTVTGERGDVAVVGRTTMGDHVVLAVEDPVHMMTSSYGHFTPIEARMIAAALVDWADQIDHVEGD